MVKNTVRKKNVTCVECDAQMVSSRENCRYSECGLPNVVLQNIEVRRCPDCGETELVIPRIAELHRVIARAVARKPQQLSPREIRFLRKYLGWSGNDFSAIFGVTPETVSRWENAVTKMSATAERLLRLCALAVEPFSDYSIFKTFGSEKTKDRPYYLTLKDHWELAA